MAISTMKQLKILMRLKNMISKLLLRIDIGMYTYPQDIIYVDKYRKNN